MKPIAPLMIEHRLIERMIALLKEEHAVMERERILDEPFLVQAVDFVRLYADRTHHGKEEDILFKELVDKELSDEHYGMMKELIREHAYARELLGMLDDAGDRYRAGKREEALPMVLDKIAELVAFYPEHIRKEDHEFFPASMTYFSESEQAAMIEEFNEFDREMIHEKYRMVVDRLAKRGRSVAGS